MANVPLQFKGVKQLVDSGVSNLPEIYVRPENERPSAAISRNFPVISLKGIYHQDDEARAAIVNEIGEACRTWGFFQVVDHGVPHSLMDKMLQVGEEFHSLPNDYKMKYFSTDGKSRMRYGTSFNVLKDRVLNWRDFLRHDCLPLHEILELLPDEPPSYREVVAEYSTIVRNLGSVLLEAISESLGLEAGYLNKAFDGCSGVMALNYYPACPQPELTLGLTSHTDPGSITILMQDQVGGLEVLKDGSWFSIKPLKHAFVVNVADQLQIASNDRYKSIAHRAVVNGKQTRMSIPVALGPSWETVVEPAAELVNQDGCAAFKATKYRDYMMALQVNELRKGSVLEALRISDVM